MTFFLRAFVKNYNLHYVFRVKYRLDKTTWIESFKSSIWSKSERRLGQHVTKPYRSFYRHCQTVCWPSVAYSSCRPKRLTRLYLSILFAYRSSCSVIELDKCSDDYRDKASWLLPWHVSTFYESHYATRPFYGRIKYQIFGGNAVLPRGTLCRCRERDENSTPRSGFPSWNFEARLRDSSYEIRPGTLWTPEYQQTRTIVLLSFPRHFRVKPDSRSSSRGVMESLSLTCYISSRFSSGSVARIPAESQVAGTDRHSGAKWLSIVGGLTWRRNFRYSRTWILRPGDY